MKLNPAIGRHTAFADESIAGFGDARLERKLNGDYQLLGGTAADQSAAKEWVSLFMHEAAVSCWPGPASDRTPQAERLTRTAVGHREPCVQPV